MYISIKKKNGTHYTEKRVVQILKSTQQEIYDLRTVITSFKQENTNLRNIVESNENNSMKIKELETENGDLTQYIRRDNNEFLVYQISARMMFLKIKL